VATKQQGGLGKRCNGYLRLITLSPSADVANLMKDRKGQRWEMYQEIATGNEAALSCGSLGRE
jgi:uncharacterized protein YdbL (DUF1318 family)